MPVLLASGLRLLENIEPVQLEKIRRGYGRLRECSGMTPERRRPLGALARRVGLGAVPRGLSYLPEGTRAAASMKLACATGGHRIPK